MLHFHHLPQGWPLGCPRRKTVFGQNGGSGEEQEQQEEFIVPELSPSYYRRLEQEEVSSSTFIVGQSSPLDFNF